MPVHEERARVDDQHGAYVRALVEHLERLVEVLLVLGDDQRRAAVLEQMTHLARRARRIDAVRNRTESLRRQIGDRPLGARVADDGHRLAGGDPILTREPAGERGDARGQLAPRRLAPDPELLRAKGDTLGARPRALDEQAGQRVRAQRFEIHAGRIIPGRVPGARRALVRSGTRACAVRAPQKASSTRSCACRADAMTPETSPPRRDGYSPSLRPHTPPGPS